MHPAAHVGPLGLLTAALVALDNNPRLSVYRVHSSACYTTYESGDVFLLLRVRKCLLTGSL